MYNIWIILYTLVTQGLEIVIFLRWMELVSLLREFLRPFFLRYYWPLFL